jgi:hypothetical protein
LDGSKGPNDLTPTSVVFLPFEEAKKELKAVINKQIKWVFKFFVWISSL